MKLVQLTSSVKNGFSKMVVGSVSHCSGKLRFFFFSSGEGKGRITEGKERVKERNV